MKLLYSLLFLTTLSILSCNPNKQHKDKHENFVDAPQNVKRADLLGNWQMNKEDMTNRIEDTVDSIKILNFTLKTDSTVNIHFSDGSDKNGTWKWRQKSENNDNTSGISIDITGSIQINYEESENHVVINLLKLGLAEKKLALQDEGDFIYTKL